MAIADSGGSGYLSALRTTQLGSFMVELFGWVTPLGGNNLMALSVAVLLGLRHATDPDHLTAISTLLLSNPRDGTRRAARLGLSWGLGHAITLFVFGVPVILFRQYLPEPFQRGAEIGIGLLIMLLAVRLLVRWHRGYFHVHAHSHGAIHHAHPHAHEDGHKARHHAIQHTHPHADGLGRSPVAAFGIGLVHGMGGSAAVGVLLIGAASSGAKGVVALLVFAAATAVSMALLSTAVGLVLAQGAVRRGLAALVPILGAASLLFGVWYSLGALQGGM